MLKQRILTAIILIPIFIALVLKLSNLWFLLFTGLFVLIGAWEWSQLMGVKSNVKRLLYLFLIFLLMRISLDTNVLAALATATVWWFVALLLVLRYPRKSGWEQKFLLKGVMGCLVLIPTWLAINFIRLSLGGPFVLLFLCVLIWGADSGAYFAGKKWGKHKLAADVSPGKTWEGLAGALTTTVIIAGIGFYLQVLPQLSIIALVVLSIVTVLFSVLGDLFESMLKRNVGIKDSGQLFPGHGGLLDRIDSLTAAAPIFALSYFMLVKLLH